MRAPPVEAPPGQAAPLQPGGQSPEPASTSVNIAIQDSKDFPSDVAPLQELFSDFTMADGRVLFECPGLVKATGIDLMNCPLNVVLKLRVCRRMPQGAVVLWHVVVPLTVISKYLLQPPHEWETWLGLFPNTQNLEAHAPETMFTQSVHLISRPEFPKLRLRFKYHNPELQAQILAQREMEMQETRRRTQAAEQVGRQNFEDLHKLMRPLRDNSAPAQPQLVEVMAMGSRGDAAAQGAAAFVADNPLSPMHVPGDPRPFTVAMPGDVPATPSRPLRPLPVEVTMTNGSPSQDSSQDRLQEALRSALGFIHNLHRITLPQLPSEDPNSLVQQIVTGAVTSAELETRWHQLHRSLCEKAVGATRKGRSDDAEGEELLAEGLRMALMGMLDDSDATKIPRTSTNLSAASSEQLSVIQSRYPSLWESYREVSALAKERAGLLEQLSTYSNESMLQRIVPHEAAQQAESKKQFEKLLAQQRQALQLGFDNEMGSLKQQLDETRRAAQEREGELGHLRAQLSEVARQRAACGANLPNLMD